MKKYLWLLALCDTAQAGQVLLERVEYQNLITKEKTEFIQHYNPQQHRLEVLEISHRPASNTPSQNKRLLQFDDEGKQILHFEEFHWDNTTQKWSKSAKGEQTNANGKEIYSSYQGKNDEWLPYAKYEKQTDQQSETSIRYQFSPNGEMLPQIKQYTLFHHNNKEALIEEYHWDNLNQQWRFSTKVEYHYDNNNETTETIYFLGIDDKWVFNYKRTYHTEADGMQVAQKFKWENEKWLPEERVETRWNNSKRQKITLISNWNAQQSTWQNYQRGEVNYLEDERIESDNFADWNEKTQQWNIIGKNHYLFDKKGQISQSESFSPSKMGWEGKRITYQYDEAGNTTEALVQQRFEPKDKSWYDVEKIRYTYDLSLRKEDIEDKDNIADEELVPMVNALIQKETYLIENNKFKLNEQVRFTYKKLNKSN
jgi:hypothetical protein